MKKIKYLLLSLLLIPFSVSALSGTVVSSGGSTVLVGGTFKANFSLKGLSAAVTGGKITYSTSGPMSVSSMSTSMSPTKNGTTWSLTSGGTGNGSTIFSVNGKCTGAGTAKVSLTYYEFSDGDTKITGSSSVTITCRNKTQAEIDAEKKAQEEANKKAEEDKKKQEEANKKAEEEKQKLITDATNLVVNAEKSKKQIDYNNALVSVNALPATDEKTKLLERLDTLKFEIAVTEEVNKRVQTITPEDCTPVEKMTDNSIVWMVFSVIFLLIGLGEAAYIVLLKRNEI